MRFTHGVRRLPDGRIRVRLSEREHGLLASLPEQLRQLVVDEEAAPEVHARLFPRVYEDPMDELERRTEADEDLVDERLAALEVFASTLAGGRRGRLGWTTELTAEQSDAWLAVVNDARLTLGVILGITVESAWEEGPDPDDPASVALWYLGWLEDELVRALMAALPDPPDHPGSAPTIG